NALRELMEKYQLILNNVRAGIFEVDDEGTLTFVNRAMQEILGRTEEELIGMNYRTFTSKSYVDEVYKTFNKVWRTGTPDDAFDWLLIKKDESEIFVETSVTRIDDENKNPVGFRGVLRDVTERKKAEALLRKSEERYRKLAENVPDIIWTMALKNMEFTDIAGASEEILGYTPEKMKSLTLDNLLTENSAKIAKEAFESVGIAIKNGAKVEKYAIEQLELVHKNGRVVDAQVTVRILYNKRGNPEHILGIARDAGKHLKLLRTDDLTGLYNKRYFEELFSRLCRDVERDNEIGRNNDGAALLFIDMNDFKSVNDQVGHIIGNEVLTGFAGILKESSRDTDIYGRFGGDEYVVAGRVKNYPDAVRLANRISQRFADSEVCVSDEKFKRTVAVGVACYPYDSEDVEELYKLSNQAMLEGKKIIKSNPGLKDLGIVWCYDETYNS
ncbi:PAS domain S-box protein, partial [Candidatus Woesearchaeota archaeon]|nr:PAS domain S-box protein [Candidatus Woesearchaeota archaeon]